MEVQDSHSHFPMWLGLGNKRTLVTVKKRYFQLVKQSQNVTGLGLGFQSGRPASKSFLNKMTQTFILTAVQLLSL